VGAILLGLLSFCGLPIYNRKKEGLPKAIGIWNDGLFGDSGRSLYCGGNGDNNIFFTRETIGRSLEENENEKKKFYDIV
jgi:hypothetical protein